MEFREWYDSLNKPSWTPDPSFIGLVWQILYPIILITFGYVIVQAIRGKYPKAIIIPFVVNLTANLIFTPIQFGLRNLTLAAVDIIIVWASIIWIMLAIWKHNKFIAIAQIPYLIWVTIASVLQILITVMN